MSSHYKLDWKNPVPCELLEWALWIVNADRTVKKTNLFDVSVSTVFLWSDHQFWDWPPLLFETMIFWWEHDWYQERYSTWEEAEKWHEIALNIVKQTKI